MWVGGWGGCFQGWGFQTFRGATTFCGYGMGYDRASSASTAMTSMWNVRVLRMTCSRTSETWRRRERR